MALSNKRDDFIKASPVTDAAYQFAVRRLVRTGSVTRADVTQTMGCSGVIAGKAMKKIVAFTDDVIKKGQSLQFKDSYFSSREENNNHIFMIIASDNQLSSAIKKGEDAKITGLYPDELPVNIKTWSYGDSTSSGLVTAIAACTYHINKNGHRIDHRASLSILYVSMTYKANAKWRNIVPLGFERVLDQWRLIAQDIDSEEYPIKTFVLARISGHKTITQPLPTNFYRHLKILTNLNEMVQVNLNQDLTKDQLVAIKNELNISDDDTMEVSQRLKLDFLRRFSDMPIKPPAIWPIIRNFTTFKKNI